MASSQRVLLTGGTGLIGRKVVQTLVQQGDTCIVISRSGTNLWGDSPVEVRKADPTLAGPWQEELGRADVVINLAGERLVEPPKRWTEKRKRVLMRSRVETTARLTEGIAAANRPPIAFLTGSAVGFYGDRGDEPLSEEEPPGNDFLAHLGRQWEAAAEPATGRSRVVWLRTGLVLEPTDGFLAPLLPLFRFGLGGSWGSGQGWLSWIHMVDEVALIVAAAKDDRYRGPLNCTAPNPVTVRDFVRELGATLGRPSLFGVPEFALRLALGEAADALLHLQRVIPSRALELGFQYRFPTLREALSDLLA